MQSSDPILPLYSPYKGFDQIMWENKFVQNMFLNFTFLLRINRTSFWLFGVWQWKERQARLSGYPLHGAPQPRVECHFPAMLAPSSGWGASLVWVLVFVKRTVLVWGSDKVVLPHAECQLLSLEACFKPKFILCVITNPKFHSGISASWPWRFQEVPWQMAPGIISTRSLELPHWHCYPA